MKKEKGITLISLVVTVVVLLILAAVSISALTDGNGIINQAQNAKKETAVADEKEVLNISYVLCLENNKSGTNITDEQLQKELEKNDRDTTVTANGDDLEVVFNDTKNKYMVYQDGYIEQIIEGLGNYMLNDGTYYDTLQQAIAAANNGDTIKIIYSVTETSPVTIDKNITIDTNRKTITFTDTEGTLSRITINEGKNVIIKGKGTLSAETNTILNYGNLETDDVTIKSQTNGHLYSSIVVLSPGQVLANDSNISGISCEGGAIATMNGGEFDYLAGYPSSAGGFVINGAVVKTISLIKGGTCTINGGNIEEILLSTDSGNIYLTIGNIDETVNNNNPQVENIEIVSGDLAGITTIINFYNGIIKGCAFSLEDEEGYKEVSITEYNVRSGYKAQTTADGTILVKQ